MKPGIRHNRAQFFHQLLQVFFVGLTIGLTRTVIPALAESDFGVPKNSFVLLVSFVVAFGVVKSAMNFVAGRLSDQYGRKRILLVGWLLALPIPVMIFYAPDWNWIVAATVLLGVNQGLTWSMTQAAKLDITRLEERGLTLGLNEFAGYVGVALAGLVTAYLADSLGPRQGLLIFGMIVICLALILTQWAIKDTLAWARLEAVQHPQHAASVSISISGRSDALARYPQGVTHNPSLSEIFMLVSWRDRRFMALSQAGLVEKFVDALVWVFYPAYLYEHGLSLPDIGWIIGVYGLVWGVSQLFTGKLSDDLGRHRLNVAGMWVCGAGVVVMLLGNSVVWWAASAAISGFGMAMLYPNLSAAVADISHPVWRGSALGVYRFWRDLGYAVGALGVGLVAHATGQIEASFWFVAVAMFVSGAVLWWLGEETHPQFGLIDPMP